MCSHLAEIEMLIAEVSTAVEPARSSWSYFNLATSNAQEAHQLYSVITIFDCLTLVTFVTVTCRAKQRLTS